jgi:hypothetical protein
MFINISWYTNQFHAFISLFDDLHTLFKAETDEMREPTQHYHANYATRRKESCTFYEEHKLRRTLIDLGMKLVCVPRNIYEHINKACQAMTPHDEDALDNQCICTRTVNRQLYKSMDQLILEEGL